MAASPKQIIQSLRPGAKPSLKPGDGGHFRLQDDGNGWYIAEWSHPSLTQPTPAEIAAVNPDTPETALNARVDSLAADSAATAWETRLTTMTASELNTWVAANAGNAAQIIAQFPGFVKAVAKLLG